MAATVSSDRSVDERPRSVEGRARWVVILLAVVILSDVGLLVTDAAYLSILRDLHAGVDVSPGDVSGAEDAQLVAAVVAFAALVACGVVFIRWFAQMYRNIGAERRRHKTGWAIGGWFVPILAIWRPKEIANDIWTASDAPDGDRRMGRITLAWWLAFLLTSFVNNRSGRGFLDSASVSEQIDDTTLSMVGSAVDIAAAVIAIVYVRAMTRRHETGVVAAPAM